MPELTATRPGTTPRIVTLPACDAAVVDFVGSVAELAERIGPAFMRTAEVIAASGAEIAGHPFSRYLTFGEPIRAEIGFMYRGTLHPTADVRRLTLPGGRLVTLTHVGPYDEIGPAWERGLAWLRDEGLKQTGPGWECYLTGPEDPGPPVTEVYFPVA